MQGWRTLSEDGKMITGGVNCEGGKSDDWIVQDNEDDTND